MKIHSQPTPGTLRQVRKLYASLAPSISPRTRRAFDAHPRDQLEAQKYLLLASKEPPLNRNARVAEIMDDGAFDSSRLR